MVADFTLIRNVSKHDEAQPENVLPKSTSSAFAPRSRKEAFTSGTGQGIERGIVEAAQRISSTDPMDVMVTASPRRDTFGNYNKRVGGRVGRKADLSGVYRDREAKKWVGSRPYFREDATIGQQAAMDRKHTEWQATAQQRVDEAAAGKDAEAETFHRGEGRNRKGRLLSPKEQATKAAKAESDAAKYRNLSTALDGWSSAETPRQTGERTLAEWQKNAPSHRLPGEGVAPRPTWYFEQNDEYVKRSGDPSNWAHNKAAITGGGSMSPLNSPENEVASGSEMGRAKAAGTEIVIPEDLAKDIGGLRPDQIGTPIKYADQDYNVVKGLSDADRRAKPEFAGYYADSPVDHFQVARGGASIDKGVRGVFKGESNASLNPALEAPKVHTYVDNLLNHRASPEVQAEYAQASDAAVYATPDSSRTGTRATRVRLEDDVVDHVLRERFGKGTDSFNPEDRAVWQLEQNRGRRINTDNMHPAAVSGLASESLREAGKHSTVDAALLSSNMPTVQDTWQMAFATNAPEGETSDGANIRKMLGSDELGYYNSKTFDDGTPVLNSDDGRIGPKAIQHATLDAITRASARSVDMPSVALQSSQWTVGRRKAERDAQFNEHKRNLNRGAQFS